MLFSFLKTKAEAKRINSGVSSDNLAGIKNILNFLDKEGLYPDFYAISKGLNRPEVRIDGKTYLMFAANNYLSLSEDADVIAAGQRALAKYGVGPGGSRVISGDADIIRDLEAAIADLTGTEDCLTFPTGYMANLAVFQALMDPLFFDMPAKSSDSVIFSDQFNHGSIIDGCRLSKAKKVVFKHDDLSDLRRNLEENNLPNKLIVTEGVFSLDGEIIDIPEYVKLAKEFGAKLMIDDAHGVGVIGRNGGGAVEIHNCSSDIDILMGCMDKAFGGTGGFLCGKKEMIKYLRIACRSSILSSAIPAGMAGAMIESARKIKMMTKEREEIVSKANYLRSGLKGMGFKVISRDPIPATALFVGKESLGIKFAKLLMEKGIYSPVVRWPAVPEGESRFRVLVMRDHTQAHLDKFLTACQEVGKQLKMI